MDTRSFATTVAALLAVVVALGPARGAMSFQGRVVEASGPVEASVMERSLGGTAVLGAVLEADDRLRTGEGGMARLSFEAAQLLVEPGSEAVVGHASVKVKQGTTWVRLRVRQSTFIVETPTVTATVRGSVVRVHVDPEGKSTVDVLSGHATIEGRFGRRDLGPADRAIVDAALGLSQQAIGRVEALGLLDTFRNLVGRIGVSVPTSLAPSGPGALPVPPPGAVPPGLPAPPAGVAGVPVPPEAGPMMRQVLEGALMSIDRSLAGRPQGLHLDPRILPGNLGVADTPADLGIGSGLFRPTGGLSLPGGLP